MISVERVESSKRSPSCAKLFGGVEAEAANVGTDHGQLEHRGEFEDVSDADFVVPPSAEVVTQPFADMRPGSRKLKNWSADRNVGIRRYSL